MPIPSSSRLSPRDRQVIQTVERFRMVTTDHISRLHFSDGSPASTGVKSRRALARLVKWGCINRLPRIIGGGPGGSLGYIYQPVWSRSRVPVMHTLEIADLYVQLVEADRAGQLELMAFDPEPYCHIQVGNMSVKPDGFLRIGVENRVYQWFIECDRSSEWRTQLGEKMRRFIKAYSEWQEPVFPRVLFIVPDEVRLRFVESVVKRQELPQLFKVVQLREALQVLTGNRP